MMDGMRGSGASGVASGMLLVATPALQDPNFADTVVLLLDVNDDGALGVVLNRPSPVLVADVLEPWREVVAEPEVLFRGGPVGTDGALAVGRLRDPDDAPVGWRAGRRRCSAWSTSTPRPSSSTAPCRRMRVFAGYAGWGAEQLEGEIEEGSWYVVPARPPTPSGDDTTTCWRDVMRRQPGELAWHVTRPVDPDLN